VLALDRIWVHPVSALVGLRAHRSRLARWASDHLPVLGEVAL
jgi:endonuclease/exonuclease/phosphatase family metal-dependent hydrolase